MKRFWMRALLCFALSAALLTGCALSPSSQPAERPTDPLTGQELVWPGQRPVAITIDNAAANTTQWGLSSIDHSNAVTFAPRCLAVLKRLARRRR